MISLRLPPVTFGSAVSLKGCAVATSNTEGSRLLPALDLLELVIGWAAVQQPAVGCGGGPLPLGYGLKDGNLTVVEDEAERVRMIFRR